MEAKHFNPSSSEEGERGKAPGEGFIKADSMESPSDLRKKIEEGLEKIQTISGIDSAEEFIGFKEELGGLIDLMEAKEEVKLLAGPFFSLIKEELRELSFNDFRDREVGVVATINDLVEELKQVIEAEFNFPLSEENRAWIKDISSSLLKDSQVEDFSHIKDVVEVLNVFFKKKESGESPDKFLDIIENKNLGKALDQKSLFERVVFWKELNKNGQRNIELLNELGVEYQQANLVNQLERDFLENLKRLKEGGILINSYDLDAYRILKFQERILEKDIDLYLKLCSGLRQEKKVDLDDLEGFSSKFKGVNVVTEDVENLRAAYGRFGESFEISQEGLERVIFELKAISELGVDIENLNPEEAESSNLKSAIEEAVWERIKGGYEVYFESVAVTNKTEVFLRANKKFLIALAAYPDHIQNGVLELISVVAKEKKFFTKEEVRGFVDLAEGGGTSVIRELISYFDYSFNISDRIGILELGKLAFDERVEFYVKMKSLEIDGYRLDAKSIGKILESGLLREERKEFFSLVSRFTQLGYRFSADDLDEIKPIVRKKELLSATNKAIFFLEEIKSFSAGEFQFEIPAISILEIDFLLEAEAIFSPEDDLEKFKNFSLFCKSFSPVQAGDLFVLGLFFSVQDKVGLETFVHSREIFLDTRMRSFLLGNKDKAAIVFGLSKAGLFQDKELSSSSKDFFFDNLETILDRESSEREAFLENWGKIEEAKLPKELNGRVLGEILIGEIEDVEGYLDEVGIRRESIQGPLKVIEIFSRALDSVDFEEIINLEDEDSGLGREEKNDILRGLSDFMDRIPYREKGRTILVLSLMKEARESFFAGQEASIWPSLERTLELVSNYGAIIEKGNSDRIPSGIRASMGLEYEVTRSVGEDFAFENCLDYVDSIRKLTECAKIGQGADGIFEINTQPTDNPYLTILEMSLLQDLGFIDFNFNRYPEASRGYHLTLGGELGLQPDMHTHFLESVLSCSNFIGVNAGSHIRSVKEIYEKGGDSNHKSLFSNGFTPMTEFKGCSCDKWEMFERAILTSHNSAIAIQAAGAFTEIASFDDISKMKHDFPDSAGDFMDYLEEKDLLSQEIKEEKIGEIIFSWIKLQVEMLKLIEDHNENFLENEVHGYLDEDGDWVDAMDFSDRNNAEEFKNYLGRINEVRREEGREPYSSLDDYFEKNQRIEEGSFFNGMTSELVNAFISINNFSLKSGGVSSDKKGQGSRESEVEVDRANVGSIFNTRIGHQKEYLEGFDDKPEETSIFERGGKSRKGYYYFQGFSERMISHQSQILLLKFNEEMEDILSRGVSEGGSLEKARLAA